MYSHIIFLCCIVGVLSVRSVPGLEFVQNLQAQKFQSCFTDNNISANDLMKMKEFAPEKMDEKYYCFAKCVAENANVLNSNGTIDIKALRKTSIPIPKGQKFDKCVKDAGPILVCSDIKKLADCGKQDRP